MKPIINLSVVSYGLGCDHFDPETKSWKVDPKHDIPYINLDIYHQYLNKNYSDVVYNEIMKYMIDTKGDISIKRRRTKFIFGDPGLVYSVEYWNSGNPNTTYTKAISWTDLPCLIPIKEIIERTIIPSRPKFNFCAIQLYPSGEVGINPHRDKEGTIIIGLSLGATRTLELTPPSFLDGEPKICEELGHGSLYVFLPPTNDYWLHSIPKDHRVKEPRISLTFRNVKI